jgi:hypothetical protein
VPNKVIVVASSAVTVKLFDGLTEAGAKTKVPLGALMVDDPLMIDDRLSRLLVLPSLEARKTTEP